MNIFRTKHPLIALPAAAWLLAASSSFAQSVGEPPALQCEFMSTQRLLTVVYPELEDGGGCRVIYEKPDEGQAPRVLWRASNDLEFCTRKLNKSAEKLVANGWNCSQREDAIAYSIQLAAALPAIEADAAAKQSADAAAPTTTQSVAVAAPATAAPKAAVAPIPTAAPIAIKPSAAQPTLPAKAKMATPDADRVLPEKDTAASLAVRSNTAEPQKKTVMAKAPASSLAPKAQAPKKPVTKPIEKAAAPVRTKTNDGEYDDWLFRWDEINKQLVFTLYNSKDGTKVHNFSWAHDQMDQSAASPSNIVLAQDEHANQVLIIAWPGKDSQHITVLDPLVKERPVCEIETLSKRDSDWGYSVEEKKLFLKGFKPSAGNPAELVEFREQCTYVR